MFENQLFEESPQFQPIGFGGLARSISEDSLFKGIVNFDEQPMPTIQKDRSMIITIENLISQPTKKQMNVFKKDNSKKKRKSKCDYRKNICGYITKKIIREFVNETFKDTVQHLCLKYGADYKETRNFYTHKIQRVTGPSHIPSLIQPDCAEQVALKKVFREFFEWFLKERYIRYLLLEGKMDKKQVYIRYKNEALFQLIQNEQIKNPQFTSQTQNCSSSSNVNHHLLD